MNLIVAVAKDYAIGKDNKLLFSLPSDMKYFKEKTLNKVVVMGEKTYLSLPKRPLINRINIVLSDNKNFAPEGVIVVNNLDELFSQLKKYNDDDIFVCGGASVYNLLMEYCHLAYVTIVDKIVPADTYIIDPIKKGFVLRETSQTFEENGLKFTFNIFENKKSKEY